LAVASSLLCSAAVSATGVSLPDRVPGIVTQTAQKDKAAIVRITSVVTGKAVMPSFRLVEPGYGSDSIVGTWQCPSETVTFTEDGRFTGNNVNTGQFAGTYAIQGSSLLITFSYPSPGTVEFTFTISGDTLTLSNPQIGSQAYTRVGEQHQAGTSLIESVQSLSVVKEEGAAARLLTEDVTAGASGTGFIVSPDGYIVTNAHVVLAGEDPVTMLTNQLALLFQQELYSEASQYYNIPSEDRDKVVKILLQKFLDYFNQFGQIQDVTVNYYVLNGIASPGDDLRVKSLPAVVKKQGTVCEKIGGEWSWGRDVAILKVEADHPFPTVTLGDSSQVQVGDPVFVIGYPATKIEELFKPESILEPTVTQGVISAKRTLRTGIQALQTDAAINHGNSGGPAYDQNGKVIGIATFGAGPEKGVEAIKFLMPINLVKEFMNELNIQNEHGDLDTKYAEALEAFWHRDVRKAIAKMKEVLSLYPGHPYAQTYIDECQRAMLQGEVPARFNVLIFLVGPLVVAGSAAFFIVRRRRKAR